ncbi:hypothetical protein [Candidatus Methanoprimaticola sp. MG2]|uniref:hypothetical protein n=1 Tax=Candidatus Methanoprimaticola sp. MG2 TaxID=3228838 RepID=UPI0039C7535F
MIEIPVGEVCGYLGTIWCVLNLAWAVFRNDAEHAMVYGVGVFAAFVVALNLGGVLNDYTWSLFGLGVFGLHLAIATWQHVWWKVPVFAVLFIVSTLAFMGVV